MNKLFTHRINILSAYFFLWCFLLETVLFLTYIATESELLVGAGVTLFVILVLGTPISLAILIVNAMVHYRDIKQHVIAIFLAMVSISITILYITLLRDF